MIYPIENRQPQINNEDCFIAPNATLIGSVIINRGVGIWFNTVIRADNDFIIVGEDTNIQDACILHTDPGIVLEIGKGVTVGHRAILHGCHIDDNTLVGMGAVILNNVRIGKNCIIGASALILEGKEIPDGSLVVGSPGKIVRQVSEAEIAAITASAQHYVANMRRYRKIASSLPSTPHC